MPMNKGYKRKRSMTDNLASLYEIYLEMGDNNFNCYEESKIMDEKSLVEASVAGNYEKVVELLKSGVSVDAEEYRKMLFYATKNYMTPLQVASANGHIKCVELLLDGGADVNAKDQFDVTALHMAAEKGHLLCLKALLDAGAECSIPTKFSKAGSNRAVPHPGGTTALHLAATNNFVDCVKELIKYGADYNAIDEWGHTSLLIATKFGFSECVLTHLRNALGPGILSLPEFTMNQTPLHFAVQHKMVECVRELVRLGSDVNCCNSIGQSPLHIVVTQCPTQESMEILKMLIVNGHNTDINVHDSKKHTPLDHCLSVGNLKMAKVLFSYGADIKNENNKFLHKELQSNEEDFELLKYVVRSLSHLPPFKRLRQQRSNPNNSFTLAQAHKIKWYEQKLSKVSTLQHHCRFVIRQVLGSKLRHIGKLPIPNKLQPYILLEND